MSGKQGSVVSGQGSVRNKKKNSLRLTPHVLLLTVFAIYLAGCASGQHGLKAREPLPKTDEILKGLEIAHERVNSLKGLANVNAVASDNGANVKEVMVVKRPGKLRFETIGLFGSPILVMATDGLMLTMHMPAENRFSRRELSSAAIPFPFNLLGAGEVADIFLGSTPVVQYSSSRIEYSDNGNYLLTLGSSDGLKKQVISLEAGTLRLMRSEIKDGERGIDVSINYSDYQDVSGISFPKEIKVKSSPNPNSLIIRYEDIELNPEIDDDLFVLVPPATGNVQ